jgi:hypothetical protein
MAELARARVLLDVSKTNWLEGWLEEHAYCYRSSTRTTVIAAARVHLQSDLSDGHEFQQVVDVLLPFRRTPHASVPQPPTMLTSTFHSH